jgi:hypothetical protein
MKLVQIDNNLIKELSWYEVYTYVPEGCTYDNTPLIIMGKVSQHHNNISLFISTALCIDTDENFYFMDSNWKCFESGQLPLDVAIMRLKDEIQKVGDFIGMSLNVPRD